MIKNLIKKYWVAYNKALRGNCGENPKQSCCRDDGDGSQKLLEVLKPLS